MAIRLNIISQFDNRGVKEALRDFSNLGRSVSRGLDMAVIGGLTAATAGLIKSVKAASDYKAEMTGVEQVFGDAAASVKRFADTASETAGITSTEALQASKTFGLFAQRAGLAGEAGAQFSTSLVQLAGDLGSFNETPTAEVLGAIQSALQGQTEPMRKFGVFITEDALKMQALNDKIWDGTGKLDANQKMMATYSYIMAKTKIQQGDFTKYNDDFGNSLKTTTAKLQEMSISIGNELLPVLTTVMPQIQAMVPLLGTQLKAAVKSVDWSAVFAGLINAVSFLIQNLPKIVGLVGTFWAISTAIKAASIAMTLFNGLWAAATVAVNLFARGVQFSTMQINIMKVALVSTGVGAIVVGLGMIAQWLMTTGTEAEKAAGKVDLYNNAVGQIGALKPGSIGVSATPRDENGDPLKPGYVRTFVQDGVWYTTEWTGTKWTKAEKYKAPSTSLQTPKGTKPVKADTKNIIEERRQAMAEIMNKQAEDARQMAQQFKQDTSLSREYAAIGNNWGNQLLDGLFDSFNRLQGWANSLKAGVVKNIGDTFTALQEKVVALQKRIQERTDYATGIKNSIVNLFDLSSAEKGVKGMLAQLRSTVEQTKAFRENLMQLNKLGLNQELYKKIADNLDFKAAAELVKGGTEAISEVNSLYAELGNVGADIGVGLGNQFYNLGQDLATGFIRVLEAGFIPLGQQLNYETAKAAQQAKLAAAKQDLKDAQVFMGINSKAAKDAQAELDAVIANIKKNPITAMPGSAMQMAADARALQYSAGAMLPSQSTMNKQNVYNINVTGGLDSKAAIGQSIVEAIQAYERSSGSVYARA